MAQGAAPVHAPVTMLSANPRAEVTFYDNLRTICLLENCQGLEILIDTNAGVAALLDYVVAGPQRVLECNEGYSFNANPPAMLIQGLCIALQTTPISTSPGRTHQFTSRTSSTYFANHMLPFPHIVSMP